MYRVFRTKGELFDKKVFRKRDKDFGEFLNTKYNNDEYYYQKEKIIVYRKCAYCKRKLNDKENIICIGCGCQTCGKYHEGITLYYNTRTNEYICRECCK